MATTDNDALAHALLDHVGDQFNGGKVQFRSGSAPGANNAATGTLLAEIDPLPTPAFNAASSRQKTKTGTWQDPAANAAGTLGHFRMINAAGTRIIEGTISAPGGGGDMEVTVPGGGLTVAINDIMTVTALTLTH